MMQAARIWSSCRCAFPQYRRAASSTGLTPPVALELVAQAVLSAGGRSRSRGGAAQQRGASGAGRADSGSPCPVPPCARHRAIRPRAAPPAQFPSSPAHAAPGQPPCLGSRSRGGAAQQRGASGGERTAAPRARFPRARQVPACSCPALPPTSFVPCMFFFIFYGRQKWSHTGLPISRAARAAHTGRIALGFVAPVLVFPHEWSSMHTFCTSMHTFCTPFHRSGPCFHWRFAQEWGLIRHSLRLEVVGVLLLTPFGCTETTVVVEIGGKS